MSESVGLIIFAGGARTYSSAACSAMHAVRQACARDLVQRAIEAAIVRSDRVVTDDRAWASIDRRSPRHDRSRRRRWPFHFGRRLAEVIDRFQLERVVVHGRGVCPVAARQPISHRSPRRCASHDRVVIANNINSTDWAAITPAAIVREWIDRLPSDNSLGWVLSHDAGLTPIAWPPSPATRLDHRRADRCADRRAASAVWIDICGQRCKQLPWDDRPFARRV